MDEQRKQRHISQLPAIVKFQQQRKKIKQICFLLERHYFTVAWCIENSVILLIIPAYLKFNNCLLYEQLRLPRKLGTILGHLNSSHLRVSLFELQGNLKTHYNY